jgi:hypothetical protein
MENNNCYLVEDAYGFESLEYWGWKGGWGEGVEIPLPAWIIIAIFCILTFLRWSGPSEGS